MSYIARTNSYDFISLIKDEFLTHQSARSTRLFRKIMTKGTLDRNEYFKEPSFSGQLSFSSNAFVDSLEGKIFEDFQIKNTFGFVCRPLIPITMLHRQRRIIIYALFTRREVNKARRSLDP